MEWERYDTVRCDTYTYEFYSEGPKGKIRKIVKLRHFKRMGINVYNLAFGDLIDKGKIDDTVVSNNGDSYLVLATVAQTISIFCESRPEAMVVIKGNDDVRNRLYRIAINKWLQEFPGSFSVLGLRGTHWYDYNQTSVYEGYCIKRNYL